MYLWDVATDAIPTRIYVTSSAAVSISPGHVQLLGDGLYPYALCRDRFEP